MKMASPVQLFFLLLLLLLLHHYYPLLVHQFLMLHPKKLSVMPILIHGHQSIKKHRHVCDAGGAR
jgi:hypothetical protein